MFSKTTKPLPNLRGLTPDPARADELRRKQEALAYRPEQGFHRDRIQTKRERR